MLNPTPILKMPALPVLRTLQRIASVSTAAFLALSLSGCTYDMYDALIGHGKEPLDTEEAMARDSREILDRFEQYCLSENAVWRRTGTIQAKCSHAYIAHWGLMDFNQKWFEALTRGVTTFDATIKTRYPSVLTDAKAAGTSSSEPWGQRRYWHWRYLLGDGSTQLQADRRWDQTWNMMETAYAAEDVRMTLTLSIQDECWREHPQKQELVACPSIREALYAGPFSPDSLDSALVAKGERAIRSELASIHAERQSYAQTQAALHARYAQEQRDSQRALERGLQQGIGNVMANTTIKPPIPVPSTASNTQTHPTPAVSQQTATPGQNTRVPQQTQPTKPTSLSGSADNKTRGNTRSEPRMADFQEAVVFCWANRSNQPPARPQDERWICHGPTQLIQVAETLPKAIAQAGCSNALQLGRSWPFGKGTLYGCGFGRETYDENVAARYGVPSGILNQLQNYRCAIPHSGRCSTLKR